MREHFSREKRCHGQKFERGDGQLSERVTVLAQQVSVLDIQKGLFNSLICIIEDARTKCDMRMFDGLAQGVFAQVVSASCPLGWQMHGVAARSLAQYPLKRYLNGRATMMAGTLEATALCPVFPKSHARKAR